MGKDQPHYVPQPLKITEKKNTMVTASDGRNTITRNQSHFKKIPKERIERQIKSLPTYLKTKSPNMISKQSIIRTQSLPPMSLSSNLES